MGRLGRRFAAFAAVLAVAWQTAGAVNAVEYDPLAHCCCGDHEASEPCHCPSCPGHGSLRFRTVGDTSCPDQATLHGCHGTHRIAAFVHLPALLRPAPLAPPVPRDGRRALPLPPGPLVDCAAPPLDPPS